RPLLLVIGGEKRGITRSVLDQSDAIVRIEYGREFDQSLSASSASSILAFEVFRQNRADK
ncbi:MAG: RNA methyltransferase, partial [Clostridia bacterium]|nr:RNA methyltransferase [Clostridia bacterium]